MTAWTGTSDSSALLPVPPTSYYCPLNCCTEARKKRFNAVSQTFSALSFLFITALKRKKKKCPRTVGGFGFSIYPPNLWLTQFIKAGVVGGPAPCFPSPRHAAESPELRWQRRQRNLQHMLEELKQSPPQRRTPAEGLCHLPPWILIRDQPMQRGIISREIQQATLN